MIRSAVRRQKCRRRGRRHCRVYCRLAVVGLQAWMMRRFVDVDTLQHRVPRRDEQSRLAFAEATVAKNLIESRTELGRLILAAEPMASTPPALPDPIAKPAVLLVENRRSPVLVEPQDVLGPKLVKEYNIQKLETCWTCHR